MERETSLACLTCRALAFSLPGACGDGESSGSTGKLVRLRPHVLLHVFLHVLLMLGLELSQFGFLIGGQNLHHFGLDAGVLDFAFDHGLSMLRSERASFGFVERTAGLEGEHISVVLVHLLHQRFEGRLLFFPDCLDLGLLIAGQIEVIGAKCEHVVEVAVGASMTVHTVHALRNRSGYRQNYSGADGQNADTSSIHLDLLWTYLLSWIVASLGGPGGSPNISIYAAMATVLAHTANRVAQA